jgi:excisionase family DNA binding protein
MNKEQAAKFLGISVRTLQRYMSGHKIGFKMRRTKTGEEAIFEKEELRRFKQEMKEVTTTVKGSVMPLSEPVSRISEAEGETEQLAIAPAALMQRFAMMLQAVQATPSAAIEPAVAIENKPLLTISEARKLTGLSDGHLREAIHAGKLKGKIIGRGYRIKRTDLDDYIKKL